jgi:hypothetical protein
MERLCSSHVYMKARRQPCCSSRRERVWPWRRRSESPVRSLPKRETIAIKSLFPRRRDGACAAFVKHLASAPVAAHWKAAKLEPAATRAGEVMRPRRLRNSGEFLVAAGWKIL